MRRKASDLIHDNTFRVVTAPPDSCSNGSVGRRRDRAALIVTVGPPRFGVKPARRASLFARSEERATSSAGFLLDAVPVWEG